MQDKRRYLVASKQVTENKHIKYVDYKIIKACTQKHAIQLYDYATSYISKDTVVIGELKERHSLKLFQENIEGLIQLSLPQFIDNIIYETKDGEKSLYNYSRECKIFIICTIDTDESEYFFINAPDENRASKKFAASCCDKNVRYIIVGEIINTSEAYFYRGCTQYIIPELLPKEIEYISYKTKMTRQDYMKLNPPEIEEGDIEDIPMPDENPDDTNKDEVNDHPSEEVTGKEEVEEIDKEDEDTSV